MFLEPDEHILPGESIVNPFSLVDLMMMEDAGIKTIYVSHVFFWDKIYRDMFSYDWSSSDARIEKYLHTNLKIMLPFYVAMPKQFPNNYYINRDFENPVYFIPNYASKDLMDAIDRFANEILIHYADIRDRIHLTYAIPSGGEFLWDANKVDNYPVSDEDIFEFVIGRQKILADQYNEIWLLYHNFLGDPRNWNNVHLPFLYQALIDEFPDTPIYSIQGPHFSVGKKDYYTDEKNQNKVTEYTDKYGIKFFVGPDYCEGIRKNIDKAIEQKCYGFLPMPLGEENTVLHTSVEQWMCDDMKYANDRFRESYNGSD